MNISRDLDEDMITEMIMITGGKRFPLYTLDDGNRRVDWALSLLL